MSAPEAGPRPGSSTTKRVWEARIVAATLKRALQGVTAAQSNTGDDGLARSLQDVRKLLESSTRVADRVVRDLELRDAPQLEIEG